MATVAAIGRHDDGSGGVVHDVRQRHGHDHDDRQQDQRAKGASGGTQRLSAISAVAPVFLQRITERDHRAQQDDDGPVDGLIELLRIDPARQQHPHDSGGEGDGHGHAQQRGGGDREGKEPQRGPVFALVLAQHQGALRQGNRAEVVDRVGQGGGFALEQQDVTSAQAARGQSGLGSVCLRARWRAG